METTPQTPPRYPGVSSKIWLVVLSKDTVDDIFLQEYS